MRRHRTLLTMLVVVAASVTPRAQSGPAATTGAAARFVDPINGLTPDEIVRRALEQEPALRAVRAEVDVARGQRRQAELRPNPTFSFMGQIEPGGLDSQTRLGLEWPLDLSRKSGRVSVAEREIVAAQYAANDRERLVAANVRGRIGDLLAAVRDLSNLDDVVAAAAMQLRLLTGRVDEGALPPLDRDLVRVEAGRLEAERIVQAGRAERALIELKRAAGFPLATPLTLRQDLEALAQADVTNDVSTEAGTAATRSDVAASEARVSLADAQIDRARREGGLDLSLTAMYMRMDAGFPQHGFGVSGGIEPIRGRFNYVAGGVMMSLPVSDRRQGDMIAAQAERTRAQAALDAARLTAGADIAAAEVRDARARQALAVYSTEIRALARRNLDVVQQTYEAGRMTLVDVVNERQRYLDIERAYTGTLREAYDARQELRTARGDIR